MKKNILIVSTVVVAIIIILIGYYGYSYLNNGGTGGNPETSPTPTPELTTQEQARNNVIAYIRTNHTETEQYIPSTLTWEGGRATPEGLVGSETYSYASSGWNVTMHFAVVPNPEYTVTVTYTEDDSVWISWNGTWQSGTVTETSYAYNPPVQVQVRDDVMAYIATNHNETEQYITNPMMDRRPNSKRRSWFHKIHLHKRQLERNNN
jgi:hypothetical protein